MLPAVSLAIDNSFTMYASSASLAESPLLSFRVPFLAWDVRS